MIHLFLLITSLLACAADVESAATSDEGAVQFRTKKGALESLRAARSGGARLPRGPPKLSSSMAEITVQPGVVPADLPPVRKQPGCSLLLGGVRAKFSKAINENQH